MIPRSKGWKTDVQLAGRKMTLILLYFSAKSSGWHPALSIMRRIERLCALILLFNFVRTLCMMLAVIHAFGWLWYWTGNWVLSARLKQRGFSDFQITIGLFSRTIDKESNSYSLFALFATLAWFSFPSSSRGPCLDWQHWPDVEYPDIFNYL